MTVIILQTLGWAAFVVGTLATGTWLRQYPAHIRAVGGGTIS